MKLLPAVLTAILILLTPVKAYAPIYTEPVHELSRGTETRLTADIILLATIINNEAGNQSYKGKVAVGAVVMNRLKDGRFGSSISEIILAKDQFCDLSEGTTPESIQAAKESIDGVDPTNGALYFYNPAIATDKWIRTRTVTCRIEDHVFAK